MTEPKVCSNCGVAEGSFAVGCDQCWPTAAPKPDVCLACGHDTPHEEPLVAVVETAFLCCEVTGCLCTADRRTIAAQAAEIEQLKESNKHHTQCRLAAGEKLRELGKELDDKDEKIAAQAKRIEELSDLLERTERRER